MLGLFSTLPIDYTTVCQKRSLIAISEFHLSYFRFDINIGNGILPTTNFTFAKVLLHMSCRPNEGIVFDEFNNDWERQRQEYMSTMWKRETFRTDIVTTDNKTLKVCYFNIAYTWYGG